MVEVSHSPASPPLLKAAAFCVIAMAGVSFIDNFIGPMASDIGLVQFHVTRSIMGCVGIAIIAWAFGLSLRPKSWPAVIIRSTFLGSAMIFYFGSLGLMPIEQAFAGLYTAPLWVLAVSAFALRQPIGPWRIGAVACGFLGALMVLQPDTGSLGVSVVLPLFAGVFYAGNALATRELCAQENTMTLMFGFFAALGIMGLIATAVMGVDGAGDNFMLRGWKWPLMSSWGIIVLQAVGTGLAVFLLTRAYQSAPASYVSGFEYSALVFAPLMAFALWGQTMNGLAVSGIVLIVVSGGVVAWRESRL